MEEDPDNLESKANSQQFTSLVLNKNLLSRTKVFKTK